LGVGTDKRIAALPDVPTVAEGGVADFEAWAWNGLAAPAGTPPDVIAKLNAACQKTLNLPAVKQRFAELSVDPSPTTAEAFGAFIGSETSKWRSVITEAGISLKEEQANKENQQSCAKSVTAPLARSVQVSRSMVRSLILKMRCKRRKRRSRLTTFVSFSSNRNGAR